MNIFHVFLDGILGLEISKKRSWEQSMDSPAHALSQKRVLVKNFERFPCRLGNGIIGINVYRIFLPLAVITSSVCFEHVKSLTLDCNLLLDSFSICFCFVFFSW